MMPNYANQSMETKATSLFERMLFYAQMQQLWARLTGKPCELKFLDTSIKVKNYTTVQKTVSLKAIEGSISRSDRFDGQFRPRQRRDKARWSGIAVAMMTDPFTLGRVDLIQVGEQYYVVDGHHRISVACALGKISIDATVKVWEV